MYYILGKPSGDWAEPAWQVSFPVSPFMITLQKASFILILVGGNAENSKLQAWPRGVKHLEQQTEHLKYWYKKKFKSKDD